MGLEKRETEPLSVSTLHFLIHPGFATRAGVDSVDVKSLQLLDRQAEVFERLGPDEVVIAILDENFAQLMDDVRAQEQYIQKLKAMKQVLGRRMIVMSDKTKSWPYISTNARAQETFTTQIQGLLQVRNFVFDPASVQSFAYGLYAEACVLDGALFLRENLGLSLPTRLILELTDLYPDDLQFVPDPVTHQFLEGRVALASQDDKERYGIID